MPLAVKRLLSTMLFEKFSSILVELVGDLGSFRVSRFESFSFPIPDTSELPAVEEGGPVNVIDKFAQ